VNTTDSIVEEVRGIVAEVLALDIQDVKPSDRFFEDLQGESIDLLDLSFRCEKQFGIKFPLQGLIADQRLTADERGALTEEAISFLKQELPFLELTRIADNPLKNRLTELWTVNAIAEFVWRALAAKETGGEGADVEAMQPA
jgi:acyl carrier protein